MKPRTTTKRRLLKARRAANVKRCISTYVARATTDKAVRSAVTAALRTNAKKLRESGTLGRVQTRVCHVAAGVVGPKYRYTAAQVARIAAAYRPRKPENVAVRSALVAA